MRRSHERERWLRRNQTDAERRPWFRLRNHGLPGFKFRRQHRIGPYIVDFVCVDGGLVVEIDGGGHLHKTRSDEVRSALLYAQGFRVLRFWNDDVLMKTDAVLEAILLALQAPHPDPLPAARGEGDKPAQ